MHPRWQLRTSLRQSRQWIHHLHQVRRKAILVPAMQFFRTWLPVRHKVVKMIRAIERKGQLKVRDFVFGTSHVLLFVCFIFYFILPSTEEACSGPYVEITSCSASTNQLDYHCRAAWDGVTDTQYGYIHCWFYLLVFIYIKPAGSGAKNCHFAISSPSSPKWG